VSRAALAVFVALVAATFGAFFVAQRLKGAPPVVELRNAHAPFSPNGDHRDDVKRFSVVVRHSETLTVEIVDAGGGTVRRLADHVAARPFVPVRLRWNGRDDAGSLVPDGVYHVRVTLGRSGRTVTVPRGVRVDTAPPRPYVKAVGPSRIIAPGGSVTFTLGHGGRSHATEVNLVRTDLAHPRVVVSASVPGGQKSWTWDGEVDGRPAPAGTYLAQLVRVDGAGNIGRVPAQVPTRQPIPGRPGVTVRGIGAQPPVGPVRAGARVAVDVDSRRRPYRWRLDRVGQRGAVASGRATGTPLRFTAPGGRSGLYVLSLRAGRNGTRVPILVQSARRARLLVVMPSLSWEGEASVDDNGDGQPDTLAAGGPVAWPRVLPELPAGLRTVQAPLLTFLDRAKIRYDVTTDLALSLGDGPRATDRPAVLLAGPERWITVAYGRRLRRYVEDGGRLATIATGSLRRGVTLLSRAQGSSGQLIRPTQAVDRDPLGARLRPLRTLPQGTTLQPIAGSATAPLLAFWDGTLSGFGAVEESEPPDTQGGARLVTAVGVAPGTSGGVEDQPHPVLTQTALGKGTVIRVGLPDWAARTTTDTDVAQLTWNAVDVLLGVKPSPHDLSELAPPKPKVRKAKPRHRRARRG
jgi:flagellar hook assembly protein FlgD